MPVVGMPFNQLTLHGLEARGQCLNSAPVVQGPLPRFPIFVRLMHAAPLQQSLLPPQN